MGRKKQMVRQMIMNQRNQTKENGEQSREKSKELKNKIDEEEHQKRIEMLKTLGLMKEKDNPTI